MSHCLELRNIFFILDYNIPNQQLIKTKFTLNILL